MQLKIISTAVSFLLCSVLVLLEEASSKRLQSLETTGNIPDLIQTVREEIRDTIRNNRALAPKYLRLSFHDCVGGCDGCVDLTEPDNNGLEIPMQALSSIVSIYGGDTLSRADIWALAGLVGAEMTQAQQKFELDYIGRTICEATGQPCLDGDNNPRECREDLGDAHQMPHSNLINHEILEFFADNFGFNAQEVVALMGAHSVGTLTKSHSGFDGPVGWDDTNYFLDIDYYRKLIGGGDPNDLEDLMEASPGWTQETIDNGGSNIPNRVQWFRRRSGDVQDIISLNTDIGLCRDFAGGNIDSAGMVSCGFKNPSRWPHAQNTIHLMATYRFNEAKFLQDLESVLKKMIVNGYDADSQLTRVDGIPTSPLILPSISVLHNTYQSGETVRLSFKNPDGDRVWISVRSADSDLWISGDHPKLGLGHVVQSTVVSNH